MFKPKDYAKNGEHISMALMGLKDNAKSFYGLARTADKNFFSEKRRTDILNQLRGESCSDGRGTSKTISAELLSRERSHGHHGSSSVMDQARWKRYGTRRLYRSQVAVQQFLLYSHGANCDVLGCGYKQII